MVVSALQTSPSLLVLKVIKEITPILFQKSIGSEKNRIIQKRTLTHKLPGVLFLFQNVKLYYHKKPFRFGKGIQIEYVFIQAVYKNLALKPQDTLNIYF